MQVKQIISYVVLGFSILFRHAYGGTETTPPNFELVNKFGLPIYVALGDKDRDAMRSPLIRLENNQKLTRNITMNNYPELLVVEGSYYPEDKPRTVNSPPLRQPAMYYSLKKDIDKPDTLTMYLKIVATRTPLEIPGIHFNVLPQEGAYTWRSIRGLRKPVRITQSGYPLDNNVKRNDLTESEGLYIKPSRQATR